MTLSRRLITKSPNLMTNFQLIINPSKSAQLIIFSKRKILTKPSTKRYFRAKMEILLKIRKIKRVLKASNN